MAERAARRCWGVFRSGSYRVTGSSRRRILLAMRTTTSAIAQSTWLALAPKDFLRHYYIRYSGPGGLTEQDDMENWNYASAASKASLPGVIPIIIRWAWAMKAPIRPCLAW